MTESDPHTSSDTPETVAVDKCNTVLAANPDILPENVDAVPKHTS